MKVLLITLIDDTVLVHPIDKIFLDLMRANKVDLKTPIDHPIYAGICHTICVNGMKDQNAPEDIYRHIAPSQIKSVTMDFNYKPAVTIDHEK
ncbi:MAG: hypothetical protein ACRC1W_01275 [Shewanella sp.]